MELALGLLQPLLVSTDEQGCHVVRVGELPRAVVLVLSDHIFEVVDHLLTLSSLLEACSEQSCKLTLVSTVRHYVNGKKDG